MSFMYLLSSISCEANGIQIMRSQSVNVSSLLETWLLLTRSNLDRPELALSFLHWVHLLIPMPVLCGQLIYMLEKSKNLPATMSAQNYQCSMVLSFLWTLPDSNYTGYFASVMSPPQAQSFTLTHFPAGWDTKSATQGYFILMQNKPWPLTNQNDRYPTHSIYFSIFCHLNLLVLLHD